MIDSIVNETNFESLQLLARGKVRDIYNVGNNLLIVATDRISAFDVIMDDPVPDKGKILTKISIYWFRKLSSIIANHLISINPGEYPDECSPYKEFLIGRSMLVQKAKPLPVECVVRGYISGSGWLEYKKPEVFQAYPCRKAWKSHLNWRNRYLPHPLKVSPGHMMKIFLMMKW